MRRINALPPPAQNGGFGVPEVSTHLHNFHSAPDSDGGPCDPRQQRFSYSGQYYDYYYNMHFAGWNSTNKPDGNIQEAVGFLWYHDHRVDHTAENTYKWLAGPAMVFNEFDTGEETTGLRLPQFPQYQSLYIVSGLASSGFGRGPMAGKLLADYIHSGHRHPVLAEADPARCVTLGEGTPTLAALQRKA